jgi:hypothetical protein
LFRLRLHFVLKERIGIDEIGAEQLLTIGLRRVSDHSITSTLTSTLWTSRAAVGAPGKGQREASRCLVLIQAPHRDPGSHDLFCIRLHFVLEERIGVGKISASRFLPIDEDAQLHFEGDRNFETTSNTMMISRQGSHRKVFAELAVIGLAHRGHVMLAKRNRRTLVPHRSKVAVAYDDLPHAARFALPFSEKHSRIWMRSSSAAGPSTFLSWFQSRITSRCFSTVMSHLQSR